MDIFCDYIATTTFNCTTTPPLVDIYTSLSYGLVALVFGIFALVSIIIFKR